MRMLNYLIEVQQLRKTNVTKTLTKPTWISAKLFDKGDLEAAKAYARYIVIKYGYPSRVVEDDKVVAEYGIEG